MKRNHKHIHIHTRHAMSKHKLFIKCVMCYLNGWQLAQIIIKFFFNEKYIPNFMTTHIKINNKNLLKYYY